MKKKLTYGMLLFLLISMILSGCIKPIKNTDTQPETDPDDGAVQVIHEDQGPAQGGILNLFMINPDTLNPLSTKNPTLKQLSAFVFDSLFYETEDGTVENQLAQSYSFSQDGLVLDIVIRENILFHDGQALTADDAAFTIEAIQDAGLRSLYSECAANIQSAKAVNRLSLRIVLKKADTGFIEKLVFPVVPQHVFKDWPIEGHSDTLKLIGTGPFKFDSFRDGVILLLRNDTWWHTQSPDGLNHPVWLDGIKFRTYADETYMMQAFQKQEIDIAWLEDGESDIYSKRSDIYYNEYESNTLEFLMLSHIGRVVNSPIALEQFRTLLLKYLSGYFTENPINIGQSSLESVPGFDLEENKMNRSSTLEALALAGFTYKPDENILIFNKDGSKIPVQLSLKFNGMNTDRQHVSEKVTAALFEIGIQVTPESTAYSEQKTAVGSGKYDMMLLGCRMPFYADMAETLELVKRSLGAEGQNAVILPLFREHGAVLYHNRIRGLRIPFWKNIYNGWQEWYLAGTQP